VVLIIFALVFYIGWTLARGANMQSTSSRPARKQAFLGVIEPRARRRQEPLLNSGFLGGVPPRQLPGEILMATGLTLVLGYPVLGGVALSALLRGPYWCRGACRRTALRRQYGELWTEYAREVPRRSFPGFY